MQPILWRLLGVDDDGVACLLSEYIIDCFRYHNEKDKDKNNPLQYRNTLISDFYVTYGEAVKQNGAQINIVYPYGSLIASI